jgi:DNA-binding transcriptional LysR family regulator
MELRTLRVFAEVVRQGGFTEAARILCSTQSTASKAVRQLEEELGLKLLDRLSHGCVPTDAGEIVYRHALKLLAEREELLAELGAVKGLRRGTLRLGLPAVGSDLLFAPIYAAYRERYPQIDIRLTEHGSKRLEEMLRAGELDLAGLLLPLSADFSWQEHCRSPIVGLVSHRHPLAGRAQASLAELADTPFALLDEGFAMNPMLLEACRRQGFRPEIRATSSQISFLQELAAAHFGVAFLPRMVADAHPDQRLHAITIIEPGVEWHLALAWRRESALPLAARAWVELARGFAQPG